MATTGGPGGGGYTPPTSGPVTAREVYQLLLDQGFSTVQAIGILANAENESSVITDPARSPEAVGDGGTSFGFVQFHEPGYSGAASLVTGNPQQDIRAQVSYLAKVVSPAAVAGSTPSQVAGNFAQHFEVCQGCQPGQTQYVSRVGNVAAIAAAVNSGNWGTELTSAIGAGGGNSSSSGGGTGAACLIQFPGVLGIGATCLLSKSQARALIGGLLLLPAAGSLTVGVVVLAAFAFRRSGAQAAVGSALTALPLPQAKAAGAAVAAAGGSRTARAGGSSRQDRRAAEGRQAAARERREGRQYDEVMARTRDSRRGAAPRERDRSPVPF